jgi:hypothetical protein
VRLLTAQADGLTLAHGIGGSTDLPIPPAYALVGASWALAISFVILGFAWRTSRFRGDESGRPVPWALEAVVDSRFARDCLRLMGLAFTAYVAMAAFVGKDLLTNPTFGVVYVLLWVGMVVISVLLGSVWPLLSPVRTIHLVLSKALRTNPESGVVAYPTRLGYWPAAAGLLAFVWLELVKTPVYLAPIVLWFGVYFAWMFVGSALFETRWFERADPFEVYFGLAARLSPWGRRTDGRLVVRNPLENLDGVEPGAGLVAVVSVLFGSTGFDTFKDTLTWNNFVTRHDFDKMYADTLGLLAFVLGVALTFSAAMMATGWLGHIPSRRLPAQFAHAVVPIVLGYVIAHYLSFLVLQGQQTLIYLSDPLQRGWNVFGTANRGIDYALTDAPSLLASLKVMSVITGHVLGVISSHDRAVRLLPRRYALLGQLPLLILMVGYTIGGLTLLLST